MFKDRTRRPAATYEVRAIWALEEGGEGRTRVRRRTSREAKMLAMDQRASARCIEACVVNLVTGEIC